MGATIRRWGLTVALVLAVVPFVVAVGAAVHDGWKPLGDDAAIATLSHDTLSTRTPLVGMPSTIAGAAADAETAHHPGPLMFWTLAVPERATDSSPIGLLVGATLVNALSVLLIGWVTSRIAGDAAGVGAIVLAFVIVWALGRQTIVDVWNPYIAVFPLLALLVVTWAAVAGRPRALWPAAVLASFVAQSHLLYVPLGVTLGLTAVAGTAYTFVRRARAHEAWRRDALWVGGGTVAILAVVWMFPFADQLLHDPGNFVAIDRSLRANQGRTVGVGYTARTMVQAIGVLPLFARQATSYTLVGRSWSEIGVLPIASAFAVLAGLTTGTVLAVRRRDRVAVAAGGVAAIALVVSGIAIARLPAQIIDVSRYRLLQLWAVGGFAWLATALVVVRALPAPGSQRPAARDRRRRSSRRRCCFSRRSSSPGPIPTAAKILGLPTRSAALAHNGAPHLDKKSPYSINLETDAGLIGVDVQFGLWRELARRGFDIRVRPDDPYLSRSHSTRAGEPHLVLQVGEKAHRDSAAGRNADRVVHHGNRRRPGPARDRRRRAARRTCAASPRSATETSTRSPC